MRHAREHTAKVVRVFAAALDDGRAYLVGEHLTVADVILVHCLDWADAIGWTKDWASDQAVQRGLGPYLERCRGREAYKRAKALP